MINSESYKFLPHLFLRAPHYSYGGYDLSRLPAVLLQQDFRNAIWLASPAFHRVLQEREFNYDHLEEKHQHTLHKYYNRICFRPTPFGSFASFTLMEWGSGDAVKLGQGRLHLLPDQQLIRAVDDRSGGIWEDQDLTVNPCLYQMNKVFRYIKSAVDENGSYEFSIEGVEAVKFHAGLLSLIRRGERSIPQILDWIGKKGRCSPDEAKDYLEFLIREQVLLGRSQGTIIRHVEEGDPGIPDSAWTGIWKRYQHTSLSKMPPLADISAELDGLLPARLRLAVPQYFYAAAEKSLEKGGPDRGGQPKLHRALELLQLLSGENRLDDLETFISEFRRRFDQAKIPLLVALDSDRGIVYGGLNSKETEEHMLDDIRFPGQTPHEQRLGWTDTHQLLLRLWAGSKPGDPWAPLLIGQAEIDELKAKQKITYPLPQTQALMYRDTGEHIIIEQVGGVSAASLVGRFS
ncbi:MAG TPA: lantibiotic dehydratase, partial [Puia sp.]|nr:lantibiotic dehydratase [Puia sp.]